MARFSSVREMPPPGYEFGNYPSLERRLAPLSEFMRTEVPNSVRSYYAYIRNARILSSSSSSSLPSNRPEGNLGGALTSSNVSQPASPSINDKTLLQDDFDPEKFDPTNLSFKETYNILSECDLDKHLKFVRDTILKYSLCLRGFPASSNEDLMMDVYVYFEEKFHIQAKLEFCARFDNHNQKNLVGVLLDSIQTKNEILNKATKMKCKNIKIMENGAFHWILYGYNGPNV